MESAVEQEYPHDDFPYQKITLLEYNQKAKGGKQQMAENNNNFKSTVEALFQGMDGGVSCANCGYDSSSSFTNIGSRLAFRGEIEEAESVTAFKAIKAILA